MKRSLIIGLLTLAITTAPCFGTGTILLDNYNSYGPLVTYGSPGIPANGISGPAGVVGTGLLAGWTAGFYYAPGDVTGSLRFDGGYGLPPSQNAGFVLATGAGSTASFCTASTGNTPGTFFSDQPFTTSVAPGGEITVEVVAYSGSSYATSTLRAHSAAFTMVTSAGIAPNPTRVGDVMPAFSVSIIPEPSTFALTGLALLLFRGRKLCFAKFQISKI